MKHTLGLFFSTFITSPFFALAGPIQRRGISSDLLAKFNLYEQYAAATYCPGNDGQGITLNCSCGNCPLVEETKAVTLLGFINELSTDVTGYVATDPVNNLIVVAFRGSVTMPNFIADIEFTLTPIDICTDCNGETGFWSSWTQARQGVFSAVKSAATINPNYKIISVGHSLGGAIAAYAAAELRNSGYIVDLATFGQPRVGDVSTSQYITNQAPAKGNNYRITHTNDPVPRMPFEIMGYVHISPEYYISSGIGATPGVGDVTLYEGLTEEEGNAAWLVTDTLAHLWYFNSIAMCSVGNSS